MHIRNRTVQRALTIPAAFFFFAAGADALEYETGAPRERPVIGAPHGPVAASFDHRHHPRGLHGYRSYAWPHAYGWPGAYGWHDAWMPLYAPGEGSSVIWVAAGSHGYLGGGFATVQPLNDHGWYYGLAVSYEQGRDWFWDAAYNHREISPSLTWHGKRTSVHLGVSLSETRFDGPLRPRGYYRTELWEDDRPHVRHRLPDGTADRFNTRGAGIGLEHRFSENLGVSFGVSGSRTEADRTR